MRQLHAVLVLALLAPFSTAQDQKPAKAPLPAEIAKGNELIHQGEIAAALDLFKQYEQANPGNKYSAKAIRPLTQAVQLEKIIEQGDHTKFAKAADWLQRFYTVNKVPTNLLPLAEKAWTQLPDDVTWGTRYAAALADDGCEDKALEVYATLLKKKDDPAVHAKAAVLLARLNRTDEAREHLAAIPADSTCPTTTLEVARTEARLGRLDKAGAALKRSFELTPPSQLATRKELALTDPDLAQLRGTDFLARAQEATSLVPEPTGSACDTCAQKSSCGKSEGDSGCEDDEEGCGGEQDKTEAPPPAPVKK